MGHAGWGGKGVKATRIGDLILSIRTSSVTISQDADAVFKLTIVHMNMLTFHLFFQLQV